MDAEAFRNLNTEEIARLVREAGPKVCVFPINGTRRWFMLEYPEDAQQDFASAYFDIASENHARLYQLLFDHGIDTLLTPVFGPDLQTRGDDYMQMAIEGLILLTSHPSFVNFYREYGVQVRFYGDYRKFFAQTPYAHVPDLFDELTAQTVTFDRFCLFFGVCANDAAETIAALAVEYHAQYGQLPDKRALIESYYGEYIPPVDLFIGFDKFCVFDMPLIATGDEDLYFTVTPSPYLAEAQLRDILYDHLYSRPNNEPDYAVLSAEDWVVMRDFYRINAGKTQGVGTKHRGRGYWYPLPQVQLPPGFGGT